MKYKFNILIAFCFLILSFEGFGQEQDKEISERPKYAPRGEKHMNTSNEKGKQGLWKFYNRDKTLIYEYTFKNDIKHGPCSKYYSSNGVVREESNYFYGKKDGEYKSYYSNGQLSAEGSYKDGKKSGAWITYNKSSGEKKSEGSFLNNNKDGLWITYNNKGEKTSEGSYVNGLKEGAWSYYEEGKLVETKNYTKGSTQVKVTTTKTTTKKTKTVTKGTTDK
jgi:antitoxin component YwqK of YwqJK toxin-antitoxin module